MSATDKTKVGRVVTPDTLALIATGFGLVIMLSAFGVLWLGYEWAGLDNTNLPNRIVQGEAVWPVESTYLAVIALVLVLAVTVGATVLYARRGSKELRVDRAAPYMATDGELADMSEKGRKKDAKAKHIEGPLLPVSCYTLHDMPILVGPESTTTCVTGPRGGKSSALAIPRILEWQGPLLVTLNKRDLVDVTRRWREQGSRKAWVFDPQSIYGEEASWYWDPISYVAGGKGNMDIRAARLANRFAFSTGNHTKGGDYFNVTGEGLVASLILACAVEGRTIMHLREWVTNPSSAMPADLLRRAGYAPAADALTAIRQLNADQRDGIFGTADSMTKFLTYQSVVPWVTRGGRRVEFDPYRFVRSEDTLYSVSKEGQGSMGPLVTALTAAIGEAAEETAEATPKGRLAVPLGMVLDEVANVCKWAELPNVFSHYGSKGIIIMAFFQSWSQGANVWGDAGMKALWSASTDRIIGPGVAENGFLESVSHMIGEYTKMSNSTSWSDRGVSGSVQGAKDTILTVADLTALPPGRAVLVSAGHRPALVKLVPWWERPYGKKVAELNKAPETNDRAIPDNGYRAYNQPLSTVHPYDDADDYTTAEAR